MLAGLIGAAVVALVIAGIAMRPKKARFSFEERVDYIVLTIKHRLWSDDDGLVTMSYLREALRLKLLRDYRRLLIKAKGLSVADEPAFWLLMGGLGPLLLSEEMKSAIVCHPRGPLSKRIREYELAECFGSEKQALGYLRSDAPPKPVTLDREWVEALLVSRKKPPTQQLKRAA
jgi:hypothetical protein